MQSNQQVKALILAGGLGTRLRPITNTLSKCLVPIADRPLLDYWFDRLAETSVREVLINNHHLPDQVREYIAAKNAEGRFNVSEAFEPTLLGSAGTIAANRSFADGTDAIVVIYADNLSDVDLAALIEFHTSHNDPFTMMLFHTQYPEKCGIAALDSEQRIVEFVEKPKQPKSDLANGGVYVLDADAFREISDMNAFDLGFDVLPRFIGRMRGWTWNGYHRDIGTLESLEIARAEAPRVFLKTETPST